MFFDRVKKSYLDIIKTHAFLKGEFTLSSGVKSDTYIDMRRVSLDSYGSFLICCGIDEILDEWKIDNSFFIGGPVIGADPIIGAYLSYYYLRYGDYGIQGFLVRKEAKTHGTCRQIEGPELKDKKVIVIEDVTTTGKSAIEAVMAVEKEGGEVLGVISALDRQMGAAELFEKHKYRFASLAKLDELL